ncbi:hypothetical protein N0V88_006464 [Collariella sp. IMI 366227]|nr:hypothetical protein N0V88_006464 [Collariella sp. IMI 366227]
MASLITDKEKRLCSERYRMKDLVTSTFSSSYHSSKGTDSGSGARGRGVKDFAGRYVFPYDAEDIKAHKWFRNIPWERLHELQPPLVPKLRAVDDTRYFDDIGSISDWDESSLEDTQQAANKPSIEPILTSPFYTPPASALPDVLDPAAPPINGIPVTADSPGFPFPTVSNHPPVSTFRSPAFTLTQEQLAFLRPLRYELQELALAAVGRLQAQGSSLLVQQAEGM